MGGRTIGHLKKDNRSKEKKQADFLAHFSILASVSKACEKSKVPRSNIYDWLKVDETFKKLYDEHADQALGALEDEAVRRAYEGTDRPVYQSGKKVGKIREYSDTLLIVLLKARAPERYRDNFKGELSGPNGKPLDIRIVVTPVGEYLPLAKSESEVDLKRW